MARSRSRIRARLFLYFACVTLAVALAVYLSVYLVISPSLRRTAYESLSESARAQMTAVDQSVRALNSVSMAITYSPRVRACLGRMNEDGTLSRETLKELSDQLVAINGPMLPAAQVRLYAIESPIMVAVGMLNGQYNYDATSLPWMDEVIEKDGAKALSLPEADGTLVKYNRYIALRRLIKQNYRKTLGVVEVVADAGNLLKGVSGGEAMDVYIINDRGETVYPPGGEAPERVLLSIPRDGTSGILELSDDLMAWRRSSECEWTLCAVKARGAVLKPLNDVTRLTLLALGALLSSALALSYFASRQFTRPIHALADNMARFNLQGAHETPRERAGGIDELVALNDSFDGLKRRLNNSLDELILIKQQEMQSHMLALQSQMNPHFLYNTLSNVSALIEIGENGRATLMIESISRMLRYISADDAATVSLEDELAHVRDYIECMKLRYGRNLIADIRVDDGALHLRVPKLSIQPLIENAVKYGCTTPPPWHIGVKVESINGGWRVTVTDDGTGFDARTLNGLIEAINQIRRKGVLPSMQIGGMGLLNIAMRLKLYEGDDFLFHIQNLDGGGNLVTIGSRRGGDTP